MNSQATLQKLLQIAMCLLNDSCSVEELQQKTQIEQRSIYRYIHTLKEAGFGVNKKGNRYEIVKLPKEIDEIKNSLYLSQEEQYILYCAIEGIQFSTSPLKEVLKKKLNVIYDYKMLPKPIISELYGDNFHLLAKAIQEKKQVKFQKYHSAKSNTVTDRLVEPYAFTPNNYDVWCLDLQDNQPKTFRISRIEKVVASKKHWEHEELHKQNPVDIFRMSAPQQDISITLKLTTRAANLLKEEYPFAKDYIHSTESEDQWILKTNVCDIKGAGRFVMSLLNEIEIINSPELEKYIHEQIKLYHHEHKNFKA
ncbi:MAG: WYL domain-containing protein [Bacteroidales bacterium]|nr:WYL domain-containing protein [Bacteroidales bacterium]